ncbi:MAG: sensor histidine kinase [Ktedonobacterales bacterium]
MQAPDASTNEAPAVERAIYREYERQRRLRLASLIGPLFTVLLALALVTLVIEYLVQPSIPPLPISVILIFALCFLLYVASIFFVRRRQDVPAAVSISAGTFIIITTYQASGVHMQGFDPLALVVFGGYLTTIMLAGLIGTVPLLFATTLACNAVAIWLRYLAPPGGDPAIVDHIPIAISSAITQQWAVAGVVFAAVQGIRRTQRELGDVRVQYERARQLDALKDQFISSVNHELRNPIMALQGALEPLMLGIERGFPKEELLDLAQRGNRIADHVGSIVTSVLEARNLTSTHPEPAQSIGVYDAVVEAALLLPREPQTSQSRDLRMHISSDIAVLAPPTPLRRVLANLLSNAIKYSPPGAPLDITAQSVETTSLGHRYGTQPTVQITIRDYGLGIPPDKQPLLFNRFVRLERDLSSHIPGNGLGLFLCKQLVQSMGGHIWLESTGIEGEGTAVHIQLPRTTLTAAVNSRATASSR